MRENSVTLMMKLQVEAEQKRITSFKTLMGIKIIEVLDRLGIEAEIEWKEMNVKLERD